MSTDKFTLCTEDPAGKGEAGRSLKEFAWFRLVAASENARYTPGRE